MGTSKPRLHNADSEDRNLICNLAIIQAAALKISDSREHDMSNIYVILDDFCRQDANTRIWDLYEAVVKKDEE